MKKGRLERFLESDVDNILYWVSIFVVVLTAIIYVAQIWFVNYTGRYDLLECRLKTMTGINCPGCGGTRALKSLFKGDIFSSLYYNAFATYGAIIYILFFVTQTLERITKGKIKGIKFKMVYLWIAIGVLVIQYLLKFIIPGYKI
ncbi:MAG: DUF2752 domain-containing protein [Lachnospiraceae bacterium]|nr:DUF2752 domain-containing protein [Lachnospiraceae bacterium]MBQ4068105.1 DUF2752 domain-containing protein [Lachnospiraceae bacterium]